MNIVHFNLGTLCCENTVQRLLAVNHKFITYHGIKEQKGLLFPEGVRSLC